MNPVPVQLVDGSLSCKSIHCSLATAFAARHGQTKLLPLRLFFDMPALSHAVGLRHAVLGLALS